MKRIENAEKEVVGDTEIRYCCLRLSNENLFLSLRGAMNGYAVTIKQIKKAKQLPISVKQRLIQHSNLYPSLHGEKLKPYQKELKKGLQEHAQNLLRGYHCTLVARGGCKIREHGLIKRSPDGKIEIIKILKRYCNDN